LKNRASVFNNVNVLESLYFTIISFIQFFLTTSACNETFAVFSKFRAYAKIRKSFVCDPPTDGLACLGVLHSPRTGTIVVICVPQTRSTRHAGVVSTAAFVSILLCRTHHHSSCTFQTSQTFRTSSYR
jgi:hypothetical protein